MPVTTTITEYADKLRRSDVLLHKGVEFDVQSITTKVKYTYVEVTDNVGHQVFKFQNEQNVEIRRTEPTEDEKEAQDRKYQNELYSHRAVSAFKKVHDVREELSERLSDGKQLDWDDFGRLTEAQETATLYSQLTAIVVELGNEHDYVEAFEIIKTRCEQTLLNDYLRGTSSNGYSNAIEDTKRSVYSRFVTSFI